MKSNIEWNDVLKKEARGIDDEDLGEVQEVQGNYVLVKKGIINKEQFYIPKDQAESYDGDVLRFKITQEDLNQYQHEPPSIWDSDSIQETTTDERDTDEERISNKRLIMKEIQTYVNPVIDKKTQITFFDRDSGRSPGERKKE